jgi:Tol biopolymer transport system component
LINADGSGLRALTPEHGSYGFLSWAPDSRAIAFASEGGDVYSVSIDGASFTNLTNSASIERSPQWLPDGSRIAYVSDENGPFNIYTMTPQGSHHTR